MREIMLPLLDISTHTPLWGVTAAQVLFNGEEDDFNSHAPVGRDREKDELIEEQQISTHTPLWGVTRSACSPLSL